MGRAVQEHLGEIRTMDSGLGPLRAISKATPADFDILFDILGMAIRGVLGGSGDRI